MPNFYFRAEQAVNVIKNPLTLKVLLELYPLKKYNAGQIAQKFSIDLKSAEGVFFELDKVGFIKDNPTSGNKVLTDEGRFLLEQTATIFPDLQRFLEEQKTALEA